LARRLPTYMREIEDDKPAKGMSQTATVKEISWADEQQFDGEKPTLIHLAGDTLWLSRNSQSAAKTNLSTIDASVWRSLEFVPVVAYDLKALYHAAHEQGVELKFDVAHDVRQAAFLINPLERDRSLAALTAADETDELAVIAGLWQRYNEQCDAFEHEPKIAAIAHELDFPLTYVLYQMEKRGMAIDPAKLAAMSKDLAAEYQAVEQEMYTMVGHEFNIGSPAQLSEVLFTKLQLPTAGIKKGKTGYSTGQKELNKLRGQHPIIELIERARELAKMQNTYVDALPKLADSHNRLHTTFNQDVASTGRLSSTSPNLQNIPIRSELGRKIRKAFVPAQGNVFVSADYSQFELRLAAVLAHDEPMINDFNGDTDIHTKTASQVYKIPMDDVTKNQRRAAKVINFGVLYGMSPHGLAAAANMSFVEAKKFIDEYFELRKPIREYLDATLEKAETEGYVETYFGRRRPTPDVKSTNFMVREGAKRAAMNMPIQGTEADLMKRAMLRVEEKLQSVDGAQQILQIHDSILVETPRDKAEQVTEILRETMESIAPELPIKLKVDVSTGNDWSEV
ncbi:MAG TPA: DNA polymerase, partial [Candidatus Saccharimonadaceae bacterium]|nr:DNA polymerase [Candidatus Saccharimonadaceae bacterium]